MKSETLDRLMPRIVQWAEQQERTILAKGHPLTEAGIATARRVGVRQPERVRVLVVPTIPLPEDRELLQALTKNSLFNAYTPGLHFGYGIYFRAGYQSQPRVVAHECRHVYQFESESCTIASVIPAHLRAVLRWGPNFAPHEVDARAHEAPGP